MSADIHADRILILDFGSQYTQLIARRVRELGVYCEIHPWDMDAAALRAFAPKGIILSGGPESVTEAGSPRAADVVWSLGVPVLGICYGMQTMAVQLGGAVEPGEVKEFGYAEIRAHGHSRLLDGIEDRVNAAGHGLLDVWMSHGDRVSALPAGFKRIASTADVPLAGMADEARGYLRLPVSSRGHPYPPGQAHLRPLRARHLRLRQRLDPRQHHRRRHRRGAPAGG
jgi:GMP synthase (glutamine-hydrolysing)